MAHLIGESSASISADRDGGRGEVLDPKYKVFVSYSGVQKDFGERLCLELEGCFRFPFGTNSDERLPIGKQSYLNLLFDKIRQCDVGVVILSEEFLTSKLSMIELVVLMEELEKRYSSFKILPVLFCTSIAEFEDPVNHVRWQSHWHTFSSNYKNIVTVEKCEAAFNRLRSIDGFVYDRLSDLRLLRAVVDAICEIVPPQIKWEDSHIQGRSRMCKEIRDRINVQRKDQNDEVCVIGLYGTAGIGKTSICRGLCNEFFTEFQGRVCHAALGILSEIELLRVVLKELSNIRHEILDKITFSELHIELRQGIKEAVFLALDNMVDSIASSSEVELYLSARLPPGSIVLVTARAKNSLKLARSYLNDNNCMPMPELTIEEAESLFIESSSIEWREDSDGELIQHMVERCRFSKGGSMESFHYHPLALKVLGTQLRHIDRKYWKNWVDKIIFNQYEDVHRIYPILRVNGFDLLSYREQLFFMDVALFLPAEPLSHLCTHYINGGVHFQWLGMVHGFPRIDDVMGALKKLERMSLLKLVGDGFKTRIRMHDLWREFCVAETNVGDLERRRWVYEVDKDNELFDFSPFEGYWKDVKRMAFLGHDSTRLERLNFSHFLNVTVLKFSGLQTKEKLVVNLSQLINLESLEVFKTDLNKVVVQGLPRGLLFLSFHSSTFGWKSVSEELVTQIEGLKKLQHLELIGYGGGCLPDMGSMVSLRVAIFCFCENVVSLTGLSSQLKNLEVLHLEGCRQLRSCHGVGDLEALERLKISCANLERLPNLQKLKKLQVLDVSKCSLITALPGLECLVALEELKASHCLQLSKLPDLHNLSKLHVLDLRGSPSDKFHVALPQLRKHLSLVSSIVDVMNKRRAQVKFYHRQCEYIRHRILEVSEKIHTLLGGSEMSLEQYSMEPLIRSLDSLVGCMKKGMKLLQLCGDDYNQEVALMLSFLAPHKGSFSQFALVIRDLDWHLDIILYFLHNPGAGFASTSEWQARGSKFSWCEERCRMVYAGDGENEVAHLDCVNACLQADIERHADGRNHQSGHLVFEKSISTKFRQKFDKIRILFPINAFFVSKKYFDKIRIFSAFLRNRLQGNSDFSDSSNLLPGCFWIPGKLEYRIITVLGQGSHKVVLRCEWLRIQVAISVLEEGWPREILEAEAGLLARVQHPNVVNLLGCSYDENEKKGFIVTELMESNLRMAINRRMSIPERKFPFDLPVSIDVISQIAEAMVHVHECEVIYRDLKAENCLVNSEGDGYVVKLTDFGESKLRRLEMGSNFNTRNKGTRAWMAPEVMGKESAVECKYKWSADVYSFGMTCYEILTGAIPFGEMDPKELKIRVLANHRPSIPSYCPEGLAELIRKCWAQCPEDRPTFKEIRQSLWICKLCFVISGAVPITCAPED